jgi:flagellar P-ring protein FlgI
LNTKRTIILVLLLAAIAIGAAAQDGMQVRLKDIAYLQGVRENQLVGFGLVTGLEGKGDSSNSELLKNVLSNLLSSFSISIASEDLKSKNTAVVMITADVPAFMRPGDRITIHVSSIGDAKSLQSGVLLQTPLKAADGITYAVAQGQVSAPVVASGPGTVSTIPGGAIVEREVISSFLEDDRISILLRDPDFTTASRIAEMLKEEFPDETVIAVDASMIQISLPEDAQNDPVVFISKVEELTVVPDTIARVVVNPRTGIVVVGRNVKIGQVAITYRGTKIEIGAQPSRRSSEAPQEILSFPDIPTVDELVSLLQGAGLKTDNIIEILKGIEQAGALYGRLIIM